MNSLLKLLAFILLIAGIFTVPLQPRTAAQEPAARVGRVPVIVELFTSEGCSSCPPADQLLAKFEGEQPIRNVEIIALEEHVDYWNNGGWIDPFSSAAATVRQYAYAAALGNGNAYTPEMVVDGQSEFVGSNERQARGAIQKAGEGKKVQITLTPGAKEANGAQTFRIQVGAPLNADGGEVPEVWLAITEIGLHSDVRGGENNGEDLYHAAIVRNLRKLSWAKNSSDAFFSRDERVKLERGWKRENARVVVFVQDKKSKKILGASSILFPVS
jgi:hypothetical protein